MRAAEDLFTPLRAATMKTLTGLLAVTGMRIGEALRLTIADLDLQQRTALIAHAKFGRQRIVLLDATYWYLQAAPEVAALVALRLEPGRES